MRTGQPVRQAWCVAPPCLGGAERVGGVGSSSYLEVLVDVELDLLAGECSYPAWWKKTMSACMPLRRRGHRYEDGCVDGLDLHFGAGVDIVVWDYLWTWFPVLELVCTTTREWLVGLDVSQGMKWICFVGCGRHLIVLRLRETGYLWARCWNHVTEGQSIWVGNEGQATARKVGDWQAVVRLVSLTDRLILCK